jgi:hypothetical protein
MQNLDLSYTQIWRYAFVVFMVVLSDEDPRGSKCLQKNKTTSCVLRRSNSSRINLIFFLNSFTTQGGL